MHERAPPKRPMPHTLIRSRPFATWTCFTPLIVVQRERIYHMTSWGSSAFSLAQAHRRIRLFSSSREEKIPEECYSKVSCSQGGSRASLESKSNIHILVVHQDGPNGPPTCHTSARWFLRTEDVADRQLKRLSRDTTSQVSDWHFRCGGKRTGDCQSFKPYACSRDRYAPSKKLLRFLRPPLD